MSTGSGNAGREGMRALTFVLTRLAGDHPAYRLFEAESALVRERIYHLNLMEDGTVVLLGRLRGDLDRAERLIEAEPEVLGYSLTPLAEGEGLAYVHARPPPEIRRFLDIQREHEVFFDFPIEGTEEGGLRVVMIGRTNRVLQRALADVPAELDVTVERLGAFPVGSGGVEAVLTVRQREVLDVALELGYYEVPRRATHRDIADRMDLSVGTVTEHLQKVEARVFGTLVD